MKTNYFTFIGNQINIKDPKKQINAEPKDINILPGYSQDPRTIDKLMDGVIENI